MKLEYSLSLRDYKAAFKLHRRQKLARRLVPWIGPFLLFAALVGFIAFSMERSTEWAANCVALAAGALVVTIGAPIARFINLRRSYRHLFPPGNKDRKSSIDIDDERILRNLSGLSELEVLWSGVYDFVQDEQVTLIYTNKDCFLLFPTPLLTEEERAELSGLVARHVVNR